MAAFWVVAPCSLVEVDWRFRGACRLSHQGVESGADDSLTDGNDVVPKIRCGGTVSDTSFFFHIYRALVNIISDFDSFVKNWTLLQDSVYFLLICLNCNNRVL
jgi:hypothetical protein